MKLKRTVVLGVAGFLTGAALGWTWGRSAKSRVSESVTADYQGGVLTMQVDARKIVAGGALDYLGS